MCGICGLLLEDSTNRIDDSALERMNAAMVHRGPDDSGLWTGGRIGLAMRRLSILDLPGGHQPMTNEDGSIVVVFNGEIYNFQSLRDELIGVGHEFKSKGDTEVLIHGYEQFGDALLDRLNGMFAFAIYDAKAERLLLARDPVGIKPLHYVCRNGALAFASELGALRLSGLVRDDLNPGALDAYFEFLYIPAPDTVYEDARKLCPGEKLVWERGRLNVERYWRPVFAPDSKWTLDAAAQAYRGLLEDAVRLQRISDVPLGAFLRGGNDSSAVVGALVAASDRPVKTFTIGFDDAHADELGYARTVARRFGTDHFETILRPDMTQVAASLMRHFGEPFADSSAVPTWLVSQVARREVTVALSGDGGDELFAGYSWLHMTRRVRQYRRMPEPARRVADAALRLLPHMPLAGKLRRFSRDAFRDPRSAFRRRQTCFGKAARAALFRPELAEAVGRRATDRFAELADTGPEDLDDWMLYQDTVMYLPDDVLTKVDRMSMANSLEARVPLLDRRLVEFAATVPFSLKLEGSASKRLVKHAFRDVLPAEVLVQRKQGFSIPIHRWFREELRGSFESEVLASGARSAAYLRPEVLRGLLDAHAASRDNFGHHLWAALMFEYWLRQRP